ncbi:MAG: peptidoglycan DD-metalloendopeptidase family protein [bacterium]
MRRDKIILILSFLLISCIYGYAEDSISSAIIKEKGKLYNVTKDINEKKYKLKQISGKEKNTLRELSRVERELKSGGKKLNSLRIQLANVYKDVCRTKRSIYAASLELKNRQGVFLKRLNAIYKYRRGNLLEILFNTEDFTQMSKYLYFMALIAKADTELINDIKGKKNTYLQKEKILQSKHDKIAKIKSSQERVLDRQQRLKKDRERLLDEIRGKKSLYQQQIARLERDSLELKRLIETLEAKKRQTGQYILRGSGDLPWPVKNRKLYRAFGKYKHPKFDAYVMNKGIDISAANGETVTAIKEGKVVFANWFKGYGMLVMIDHGNGLYSLYAYLSKILVCVNEKVSKGTPIGKVGNPFCDEGYNLHFEIRVNGEPVDPLHWLMRG